MPPRRSQRVVQVQEVDRRIRRQVQRLLSGRLERRNVRRRRGRAPCHGGAVQRALKHGQRVGGGSTEARVAPHLPQRAILALVIGA